MLKFPMTRFILLIYYHNNIFNVTIKLVYFVVRRSVDYPRITFLDFSLVISMKRDSILTSLLSLFISSLILILMLL